MKSKIISMTMMSFGSLLAAEIEKDHPRRWSRNAFLSSNNGDKQTFLTDV